MAGFPYKMAAILKIFRVNSGLNDYPE